MSWLNIFSSTQVPSDSPPDPFSEEGINYRNVQTSHVGLNVLGTLTGFLIGAFSSAITLGLGCAIILHKRGYSREEIQITVIAIASIGGLYGGYFAFSNHPDQLARKTFGREENSI